MTLSRKFIYLFILSSCLNSSLAALDIASSIAGKTYPSLGAALALELGYNIPVWGEITKADPWYGMIRVAATAETSSVVYQHDTNLAFYPVSFLAFGLGRTEMTSNYSEFTYYDCDKVRCEGTMKKDYAFGKIILAYDRFIANFKYSFSRNSYNDPDNRNLPVAEYADIILVDHTEETSTRRFYFFGYKMEQDILGFLSDRKMYHGSGKDTQTNALIYQMGGETIDSMIGIGSMHSSHQKPGATVLFLITYKFIENQSIF
jgi:hypothetical protein